MLTLLITPSLMKTSWSWNAALEGCGLSGHFGAAFQTCSKAAAKEGVCSADSASAAVPHTQPICVCRTHFDASSLAVERFPDRGSFHPGRNALLPTVSKAASRFLLQVRHSLAIPSSVLTR